MFNIDHFKHISQSSGFIGSSRSCCLLCAKVNSFDGTDCDRILWCVSPFGRRPLAPRTKSANNKLHFDPREFLATIGEGRKVVSCPKKQAIFTQGDVADAVFYIQSGKVRLTVVSEGGKEAT